MQKELLKDETRTWMSLRLLADAAGWTIVAELAAPTCELVAGQRPGRHVPEHAGQSSYMDMRIPGRNHDAEASALSPYLLELVLSAH